MRKEKGIKQKANLTRYELFKRIGIGYPIIDKYYKNKVKRYDNYILEKVCNALDCGIGDIIEIEHD